MPSDLESSPVGCDGQEKCDGEDGQSSGSKRFRKRKRSHIPPGDEYLPTPEQIQAECFAIQEGWSEGEERSRAGGEARTVEHWRAPVVKWRGER